MNFCILSKPRSCSDFLSKFLYKNPSIDFFRHDRNNYEIIHEHFVLPQNRDKVLSDWHSRDGLRGSKILTTSKQFDDRIIDFFKQRKDILLILIDRPISISMIISYAYACESQIWHNEGGVSLPKITLNDKILESSSHTLSVAAENLDKLKAIDNVHIISHNKVHTEEGQKEILDKLGLSWHFSYENIVQERKMVANYKDVISNYDYCISYLKDLTDLKGK